MKKDLLKYKWEIAGNPCDHEISEWFYARVTPCECEGKPCYADLKDLFPDDEKLKDEDAGYDNYLHVYFDFNEENQRATVMGIGYENDISTDDVMLEFTPDEKAYFEDLISEAIAAD